LSLSIDVDFSPVRKKIERATNLFKLIGHVFQVIGLTIEVRGIKASIGEVCNIVLPGEDFSMQAEVVGFREKSTLLMPLGELRGIYPGCQVIPTGKPLMIKAGWHLPGQVVDGLGMPVNQVFCKQGKSIPVNNRPLDAFNRKRITEVLVTGVKAIDALLTCGKGQRLGIFSGSGVGKSTLLGMIARYSTADINVIGLIGERGREVLDFIETSLGPEGLAKSVVVAATSDQPALVRLNGAFVASALAEYFRDEGKNVLLLLDSVTRFAMAQREVGLAIGEPPATKGYTPSVFALLPRLLERSGNTHKGSITAFYTVLVEGDDMNEPIADAVRGILDGHIVLGRGLAAQNHYPAIDILNSVSRLMPDLALPEHQKQAAALRELLAAYQQAEDLINIGAYVGGSNPKIDRAIEARERIIDFLRQYPDEQVSYENTLEWLASIVTGVTPVA